MVERPIKKSERQVVAPPIKVGEAVETQAAVETQEVVETQAAVETEPVTTTASNTEAVTEKVNKKLPSPARNDKAKGNRSSQKQDEQASKSPANPALMRGPKPTKPKPPVVQKTQEEATSETESDS